ncbi:MAG: lysophospholipid acyltransferase family protein [Candidatus Hydrogenedentes bacterium]|nr:lysophospholipid acyltransferase family protein [Candidatus Hydrogenedentota bacterium]
MSRRRNPVIRWILTSLALGFLKFTSWLPLRVCRSFGKGLGRLAFYIVPRVRRVGLANLDLAYGDSLTPSEKTRLLKRTCAHFGTVFAEFSHLPKSDAYQEQGLFRIVGKEHFDTSRGALMISAHLGNWEYMAAMFKPFGIPSVGVVRSFDDPRLDRAVNELRRKGGFEPLPKNEAGPEVIRLIRDGTVVVILVDQSPITNGVPATFFGKPCWATVAPAMIALRTSAPIHFIATIRDADGGYTLHCSPPLKIETTGNFREGLIAITQQCQDAIEELVREYPEQWLWMHRRWKERPVLEAQWQKRTKKDKKT